MIKQQIRDLIEKSVHQDGLTDTKVAGLKLFRATHAMPCVPAVYEPCVIAIVSGTKEAVLDGQKLTYDADRYLCCPMSMPVRAGTPDASPEHPLFGVYVTLEPRVMTQMAIEMDNKAQTANAATPSRGIKLAAWDDTFSEALWRLLQLHQNPTKAALLGEARLKELCFAILQGQAGAFAQQAFGPGNAIARSIAHVSASLHDPISIDDMADRAGMSRAAFHRKFKQATTMSPIQFVKTMRLNHAAMKIAGGMPVNEAAFDVGYVSPSQFSREFKRVYGRPPRQWGNTQHISSGTA